MSNSNEARIWYCFRCGKFENPKDEHDGYVVCPLCGGTNCRECK